MADLRETRREQMFPKLTPAQIDRPRRTASGAHPCRRRLAEPGDRYGRLLVVLTGAIEIPLPGMTAKRWSRSTRRRFRRR
jgi:hypothetical protein